MINVEEKIVFHRSKAVENRNLKGQMSVYLANHRQMIRALDGTDSSTTVVDTCTLRKIRECAAGDKLRSIAATFISHTATIDESV